jgi:hypothetical protein
MVKSLDFLMPDKALLMWPLLEPIFRQVEGSNEIARDEFTTAGLLEEIKAGECGVFVYYEDNVPKLAFAIQFSMNDRQKHAAIVALAGEGLMRCKTAYWDYILNWLRANGVKRLEAYGNGRIAKIYRERFGFNKSCEYVRMTL